MPVVRRPQDQLRAVLVLVHVVAVLGMALPSPVGFTEKNALKKKSVAAQFVVWQDGLAGLGVPPTVTETVVLGVGGGLERMEDQAERLFRPYATFAGVRQSWRMFASSPPRGSRFEVRLEEHGEARFLYRPFDADARWEAELWEDGRVRGLIDAIGNPANKAQWRHFAACVARRAGAAFPEATAVEVQRVPVAFPTPAELSATGALHLGEPVVERFELPVDP